MKDYKNAALMICLSMCFYMVGSAKLVCPGDSFSDFKTLQSALDGGRKKVLLCSILKLNEKNTLKITSNVKFECSSSTPCVIEGGREQIIVDGDKITSVEFTSISFSNSSRTSISIHKKSPKGRLSIKFNKCFWQGITGTSAININPVQSVVQNARSLASANENRVRLFTDIDSEETIAAGGRGLQLVRRRTQKASLLQVEIVGSRFQDCRVDRSLIMQSLGDLIVTATVFDGNEVDKDLISSTGGTFQLIDSELRDNVILSGLAPIYIGVNASLAVIEGNCGDDSDTCSGILIQLRNCTEAPCEGICRSFEICTFTPTASPSLTTIPSMGTTSRLQTPTVSPNILAPKSFLPFVTKLPSGQREPTMAMGSISHGTVEKVDRDASPSPSQTLEPSLTSLPSMIPTLKAIPSLSSIPLASLSEAPLLSIGDSSKSSSNIPSITNEPSTTAVPTARPSTTYVPTQAALSGPCPTNESIVGYSEIRSLQTDFASGLSSTFVLCPDTSFSGQLTIDYNVTGATTIKCGLNGCEWKGRKSHMIIHSNIDLLVQGITFRQAKNVSVYVHNTSPDEARIIFQNCTWDDNEGEASIWLVGFNTGNRSTYKSISSDQNGQMTKIEETTDRVHLDQCSFTSNVVNSVVLIQQEVILDVKNCTFLKNTANVTMINSVQGITNITTSRFENNVYDASLGLITLNKKSKSNGDGACAFGNKARGATVKTCVGIFVVNSSVNCLDYDNCNGYCLKFEPCQREDCINDWGDLKKRIELVPVGGAVLTLCPNTTFDLDLLDDPGPVTITESYTVVMCGDLGVRKNSCVISGGDEQIRILGSPIGVEFKGVTFVGSRHIAISTKGNLTAQASFTFCGFMEHKGLAVAFNNYMGSSVLEVTNILEIEGPSEQGMELSFYSCLYQDNDVKLASIVDLGGSVIIRNNVFIGNSGQVSVAASLVQGNMSVSSSCLIGNTGDIGTMYIDENSILHLNKENFAIGNKVNSGRCASLFSNTNECLDFSARSCNSSIDVTLSVLEQYTSCFSDFANFATAVSSNRQGGVFEICPGSVFDLFNQSSKLAFLRVQSSNITIMCGGDGSRLNKCVFKGGEKQVEIKGNSVGISFLGITFLGASKQSVLLVGSVPLAVEFNDCVFRDVNGYAVIRIQINSTAIQRPSLASEADNFTDEASNLSFGNDDVFVGGRSLDERSQGVVATFRACTFFSNEVESNLIECKGARVNIYDCVFDSNSVGWSLVAASGGASLNLQTTCFTSNTFNGLQGLVSTDLESSIILRQNFGSSNKDESGATINVCAGVGNEATGKCIDFDSDICQTQVAECFDEWEILVDAVAAASALQRASVFTLCDDTTFFPSEFDAIEIVISNTVIRCGSSGERQNRCTISGGAVHFKITGSPTGILFQGITFLSSSIVSIDAAGDKSARLSIVDCAFAYNYGLAAVAVYNGDIHSQQSTGSRSLVVDDLPAPVGSMTIDLHQCYFQNNTVSFSPLAILGGAARLNGTSFVNNTGEVSGVGVWFNGSTNISSSCFTGNQTPILVTRGSSIGEIIGVYGNVDSDAECQGAHVGVKCQPFSAESCPIKEIFVLPPSIGCYEGWNALDEAIQESVASQRLSVKLIVCENTEFNLTGFDDSVVPIVISETNANKTLTILCGESGLRSGNCTVTGGRGHLKISSSAGEVVINGFTFLDASVVSIQATGERAAIVSFNHCRWNENRGNAVILVYRENVSGSLYKQNDFTRLSPPKDPSMTLKLENCDVSSNNATFATLLSMGGTLTLLQTILTNNMESRVGPIGALLGTSLAISSCCFTGNLAILPGIILVDKSSNFTEMRNAFGSENSVSIGNCNTIFLEQEGSCVEMGECDGECLPFDAKTCQVDTLDEIGTFYPTSTPTQFPTGAPSTDNNITNTQGEADQAQGGKESFFTRTFTVGLCLSVLLFVGAGATFFAFRNMRLAGDKGPREERKQQYDLNRKLSKIDEGDEDDDDTRLLEDGREGEHFLDEPDEQPNMQERLKAAFPMGRKSQKSAVNDEEMPKNSLLGQEISTQGDFISIDDVTHIESGSEGQLMKSTSDASLYDDTFSDEGGHNE